MYALRRFSIHPVFKRCCCCCVCPPLQCCRGDAPKWWMVFNPKHQASNDNVLCIAFGNVGFAWFDKRRSTWIGIAM